MKNEIVRRIRKELKKVPYLGKRYNELLEELRVIEKVSNKTINIITKWIAFIWGKTP